MTIVVKVVPFDTSETIHLVCSNMGTERHFVIAALAVCNEVAIGALEAIVLLGDIFQTMGNVVSSALPVCCHMKTSVAQFAGVAVVKMMSAVSN